MILDVLQLEILFFSPIPTLLVISLLFVRFDKELFRDGSIFVCII